jgi:uncharacterized protein (DUF427 family)
MNAVAIHLAESIEVITRTRVGRITVGDTGWRLSGESGEDLGRHDALVVALPNAQAAELVTTAGGGDATVPDCPMAPCWAVLLGFDRPLDVAFDGAFVSGSPLTWIARNNSKPGRPPGESWVLHAGPEWSSRHLDDRPEEVMARLTAELGRITGLAPIQPVHRDAHRWRYALPVAPLEEGCIGHEEKRLVIAGDWCQGARVEGAFLSGLAAAGRLLESADRTSPDDGPPAWPGRTPAPGQPGVKSIMFPPERIEPGPGQESVWDYPRPPRLEPVTERLRIVFRGETIADTRRAYRVLETSHPPTYYLPRDDLRSGVLEPSGRRSLCEWKGQAHYFDVVLDDARAPNAAWSYPTPEPAFSELREHVAFYAHQMDACYVGEERVRPQDGDFYGGWITRRIVGPFKGPRGTRSW